MSNRRLGSHKGRRDSAAQSGPLGFNFGGVSGYTLDWDASKGIVLSGSDVDSWTDQASGVVMNDSAGNGPSFEAAHAGLNGKPVVRFDRANNEFLTAVPNPSIASTEWTWYFVIDTDDHTAGTQHLFDTQTGRLRFLISANNWQFQSAGGLVGSNAAQSGATLMTFVLDSPSSGTIREDLAVHESGLTYTDTAVGGETRIGSRQNSPPAAVYGGRIARILAYDEVHDGATIALVESELDKLYGAF